MADVIAAIDATWKAMSSDFVAEWSGINTVSLLDREEYSSSHAKPEDTGKIHRDISLICCFFEEMKKKGTTAQAVAEAYAKAKVPEASDRQVSNMATFLKCGEPVKYAYGFYRFFDQRKLSALASTTVVKPTATNVIGGVDAPHKTLSVALEGKDKDKGKEKDKEKGKAALGDAPTMAAKKAKGESREVSPAGLDAIDMFLNPHLEKMRKEPGGFVYIMTDTSATSRKRISASAEGSRFKVGYTLDVDTRFSTLRTGNIDICICCNFAVTDRAKAEVCAHEALRECSIQGEWFSPQLLHGSEEMTHEQCETFIKETVESAIDKYLLK